MTWIKAILVLLSLIDTVTTWLRENALIKQGEERELAKATAALLVKTKFAKDVMADVAKLNDQQVDNVLKQLEG